MKRLLALSFFALLLVLSAAGAAPAAHAAGFNEACTTDPNADPQITCDAGLTCNSGTCITDVSGGLDDFNRSFNQGLASQLDQQMAYDTCIADGQSGGGDYQANCAALYPNAVPATPAQAAAAKTAAQETPVQKELGPSTPTKYTFNSVMSWIAQLFAWLLGVAAITLDNVVYFLVVKMGNYISSLSAVGVAWRILRDLGNIVLIFGFLAIGISVILNTDKLGYGKRMLPTLLIVAVFLNFSLFISEAVIDVGNIFATQFYTAINGGDPAGQKGIGDINQEGISNAIMTNLGLQTIYGDVRNGNADKLFEEHSGTIGFMSIILFIIAAFVMFSLSFILVARFVVLLFLIIVAPLGFAGLVVPKLESTAQSWWSQLFKQTITAPVLLLLLYIALAVITDASFLTGFSNCTPGTGTGGCQVPTYLGYTNGSWAGFASVMLSFLVAMGLLAAVVVVSKKMAAFGGDWATKTAGKLSFGATGWAMNRTVGRASYYAGRGLRQSAAFNKFDAATGRAMTRLLDRGAKGSFDIRGTKAFGAIPYGGVGAGDATHGGFAEAREKNIKDHEAAAKQIAEAHKQAFRESPEELAAIAAAEEALKEAKGTKDKAVEAAKDAERAAKEAEIAAKGAAAQHDANKAEVSRLEAEKLRADTYGGGDREINRQLVEAQKKMEESEKVFAMMRDSATKTSNEYKSKYKAVEEATARTKEMEKKKEEVEKVPGKRLGDATKASKLAYAEGIDHPWNPVTWVAYGPGTGQAAHEIKESLKKKSKDKEIAEKMKEWFKEEEGHEAPAPVVHAPATPATPAPSHDSAPATAHAEDHGGGAHPH